MKSRLNYSLHLCLLVSALALASCGKKENKVSSTPGTSLFSSSNPQFAGAAGSTIVNQVSSIKSNVACLNGGYRLSNDVNFFVNGGYVSGTKIGGNWQSGFINTGTISKMWVGVSAYRDLMFVTQVANGSQVVGFNVTLSFCELKSNMANYPSIISNSRELVNFAAPYGIVLDSNTYCGYNVVDAAVNTTIVSRRDPNNPNYTFDTTNPPVITSFTKPTCNGQF